MVSGTARVGGHACDKTERRSQSVSRRATGLRLAVHRGVWRLCAARDADAFAGTAQFAPRTPRDGGTASA